jgi:hypothetical protein
MMVEWKPLITIITSHQRIDESEAGPNATSDEKDYQRSVEQMTEVTYSRRERSLTGDHHPPLLSEV